VNRTAHAVWSTSSNILLLLQFPKCCQILTCSASSWCAPNRIPALERRKPLGGYIEGPFQVLRTNSRGNLGDIRKRQCGTRTAFRKNLTKQIRKLLHSFFCGGRMRAVQGLEDSARPFVLGSSAAILYGRLAYYSLSECWRNLGAPITPGVVCLYAFSLPCCASRSLSFQSNST
jgi:hypothetical protein